MTPSAARAEDPIVDTKGSGLGEANRKRPGILGGLVDVKDAIVLRLRSRGLTEGQRRQLHDELAKDPEIERALERALAANPQLQRKGQEPGAVSDRHV
jgi:hypothetical protein